MKPWRRGLTKTHLFLSGFVGLVHAQPPGGRGRHCTGETLGEPLAGSLILVDSSPLRPHHAAVTPHHNSAKHVPTPTTCHCRESPESLVQNRYPPVPAGPAQKRCYPECAGHGRPARSIRSASLPPAFGA